MRWARSPPSLITPGGQAFREGAEDYGAHVPRPLKPVGPRVLYSTTREATALRNPHVTTRENLHSEQKPNSAKNQLIKIKIVCNHLGFKNLNKNKRKQKQEKGKATLTSYFQSFHSPKPESYSTFLSLVLHIYRSLSEILTPCLSKLFIPLILQSELQSRSSFKTT